MVLLMGLLFNQCKKDNVKPVSRGPGQLQIEVGLEVNVGDVGGQLKSTKGVDEFTVIIYQGDGTEVISYENYSDVPAAIELEPGEYYVVAHSGNWNAAAFENPYYFGQSETFTINSGENRSITVNCELANCMVTLVYSQNILDNFTNYSTVVSTDAGSLTFVKNETRAGYFDPQPISIVTTLEYATGSGTTTKILTGSIDNPAAKKHYEIHVDATIDNGTVGLAINLDESTDDEIVEINDGGTPVVEGPIGYGDLLITEIMYDPSALADTEGEWFEIYNNSDNAIDLQNVVIRRDGEAKHTINTSLVLQAGEYCVLEKTVDATDPTGIITYIYGSALSLTNTACTLEIANYGTDGTNGSVIARVAYDETTTFPSATGASIQLDPSHYDADEAQLGANWCESTSSYSTGDMGTPGVDNISCL